MVRFAFILIFPILFSVQCLAQEFVSPYYCPIDSKTPVELQYLVRQPEGKSLVEILYLYKIQENADSCNRAYLVRFDESSKSFHVTARLSVRNGDNEMVYQDSSVIVLDLKNVYTLNIRCETQNENSGIDISNLKLLKHLMLPNLRTLEINLSSYPKNSVVNFSKWPNYQNLKNSSTVSKLTIQASSKDKELLRDFYVFKHLEELDFTQVRERYRFKKKTYEYLKVSNMDLIHFPELKKVNIESSFSFDNELATLKNLQGFRDETVPETLNSAELLFFSSTLSGCGWYRSVYIDSLIKNKANDKINCNSDIIIFARDLFDFDSENGMWYDPVLGYHYSNDTIAFGEIRDGQLVGTWKYYRGRSTIEYAISCDHIKQTNVLFPNNGKWSYSYPSGTTAIEGNFKSGKKDGVWKFYDQNGKLEEIKSFKNDLASGLFMNTRNNEEYRFFYINNIAISSYFKDSALTKGVFEFHSKNNFRKLYKSNSDGSLSLKKKGQLKKVIAYNSPEYKKIIYRNCIKDLFPEKTNQEIQLAKW